ncbi:MAG: hypothetical protein FWB90_03290 [Fibromonadales bacterium]|nr:hypothetical protein [Fibromonadales bacterium]
MSLEIPAELLSPTVEELEEKTAQDLATKWKLRKRPGKKERIALKREKDVAKLEAIAEEINKPKQPSINNLSSLFVQNVPKKFSLSDVNINNNINHNTKILRPTLRVSLGELPPKPIITVTAPPPARKRGRPPKVKPV